MEPQLLASVLLELLACRSVQVPSPGPRPVRHLLQDRLPCEDTAFLISSVSESQALFSVENTYVLQNPISLKILPVILEGVPVGEQVFGRKNGAVQCWFCVAL